MSEWQRHNVEQDIINILGGQQAVHHFGRPYLTAYQLAAEFRRRNPDFMPLLHVGGEGTGEATGRESLARYLSRELSRRIKAGSIRGIEGAMLSNDHLHDIHFEYSGQVFRSTLTGSGFTLSMFRLQDDPEG